MSVSTHLQTTMWKPVKALWKTRSVGSPHWLLKNLKDDDYYGVVLEEDPSQSKEEDEEGEEEEEGEEDKDAESWDKSQCRRQGKRGTAHGRTRAVVPWRPSVDASLS